VRVCDIWAEIEQGLKTATFFRITVKRGPISIFFGIRSPEETLHRKVVNLSTSPEICHRTTLRNAELVLIDCLYFYGNVKKLLIQAVKVWIKDIKVYGFHFLNFFTPKLYRFPHKKMNSTSCSENLSNSACERSRRLARFAFRHLLRALFLQILPWSWKQ